jgi:hypothetical protein
MAVAAALAVLRYDSRAEGLRVRKADFPGFLGIVACGAAAREECPGAADGFARHGRAGEEGAPDPASPALTAGGKVAVGFLEGKPFAWPRYSVEFPTPAWKWVVLNELSANEQNRVFLSLWKQAGPHLELVRVFTRVFPLELGETTVHARSALPDGSLLVVLKGDGADAGVRLQDYRFLRLRAPDRMEEVHRALNRSEIPVQDIMERLNADRPVEPVLDSTLDCEVGRRKAPSGGPLVRLVVTRNRVLYTRDGPEETPAGTSSQDLDIWRLIRGNKPAR